MRRDFGDRAIRDLRPPKEAVDPFTPYGIHREDEPQPDGTIDAVGTVFLTNRECPFACLMCDLWRYTTDTSVPVGAVDRQVALARSRLGEVHHLKLYNAGNFFDDRAISAEDRRRLTTRLGDLRTVIVENHPRLVDHRVAAFRDALGSRVDVAMGLETVHPDVLPRLNKSMTIDDFARATALLLREDIRVRAFILLRPPYLSEEEGRDAACRSIDFAFDVGVECCVVIPTRSGNGALEQLAAQGHFAPPTLASLEFALAYGIGLRRGRVFADLWDLDRVATCANCADRRRDRLRAMNLAQECPPPVRCDCESVGAPV